MTTAIPDTTTDTETKVRFTTPEEGRELFEYQARTLMGMGGDEFIQRWEAGEYDAVADAAGHLHIGRLASLIPFARQES